MNAHRKKKIRRCAHCGQRFNINPRVGRRHRFCTSAPCARASRAAARKKWLRKNGGKSYFRGDASKDRVREWRKRNPRYWRRKKTDRGRFQVSKRLSAALRKVALQDSIDAFLALKIGIISRISGHALQDEIASEIRRLMLRGDAILRGKHPKRK